MRFTLSSSALNGHLQTLARVINSKNSLPILDCFLFEVAGGKLNITASDSENVMRSSVQLDESDTEGSFAIPNRTILDAVKELPDIRCRHIQPYDKSTLSEWYVQFYRTACR